MRHVTYDQPMKTVQQHILERQQRHPDATGEFSWLLSGITLATKIIQAQVQRAGLLDVLGGTGEENVQGEAVQKLDDIANDTLLRCLGYRGNVGILVSEEEAEPRVLREAEAAGKYIVLFDPLDGSSNIDVNVSIGTIFGVYRRVTQRGKGTEEDLLQPGRRMVAGGYIVYGSSTMMVYTTGAAVHGFTLDTSVGMFLLSHEDIRIPSRGKIYSCNEAYIDRWSPATRRYVEDLRAGGEYKSRYIGSMVSDVHRTLLLGGLFMYPGEPKAPMGKLRLLYEAAPLAFVIENAGGASSDGERSLLEPVPEHLHDRTPVFLGSVEEVESLVKALADERAEA